LQHGVYTLLLDACYDREVFPTEEQAIQWLWASSAEEIEAIKFVLNRYFIKSDDGTFTHDDVLADLCEYHAMADRNKLIAIERETRRKELRTSRAHTVNGASRDMHESPPNQELRTKNNKPLTTNQETKYTSRKRVSNTFQKPDDVDESIWNDFLEIRKAKRSPLTETALAGIRSESDKAGLSMNDALRTCCLRGWQGFKADWITKTDKPKTFHNVAGMDYTQGVKPDGSF